MEIKTKNNCCLLINKKKLTVLNIMVPKINSQNALA